MERQGLLCNHIIPSPVSDSKPAHYSGSATDLLLEYPWLQEFIDSGISPDIALANVQWVSGDAAIEWFLEGTIAARQANQSYLTTGNAALVRAYAHLQDGAWAAKPELSPVPYFKPVKPRRDAERGRDIKYETPPGAAAAPLFPVLPGHSWECFDGAIAITEGLKKALALGELGLPAVALRGVTQWHQKGSRELWPDLAALVAGRVVYIAFDEDEKRKTRRDVSRQALGLGKAIEAAGGFPRFMQWDSKAGKGIDDYLVGLDQPDRVGALEGLKKYSLVLSQYQRKATVALARSILDIVPPTAQHLTKGEYIPTLPALRTGAVTWLDAPMNSGKTVSMGRDWVGPWVASGGVVVVLSPLNSLGAQTAQAWDIPHIHDYSTDKASQSALAADISVRGGVVACFNSIHRVAYLVPSDRPLLLILDEAAQVIDGAAEGGTLRSVWSERWETFIELAKRASAKGGAIALAESGLDWATIDLVKKLSGAAQVIGIRHQKETHPWDVQIMQACPLSGFRSEFLARVQRGEKILLVTTSQTEGRRLEKAVKEWDGGDELLLSTKKVIRIDSQTNERAIYRDFFECPEAWLEREQPDLLILSPSVKTGLSIEGGVSVNDAYFSAVYGYFPNLDTDTQMQLLGRYRPAVARFCWAPAYINPEPNEKPNRLEISTQLESDAANYARIGGFTQSEANPDNDAIGAYLASRRARRWAQKVYPVGALLDALTAAGHNVDHTSGGSQDKALAHFWKTVVVEGLAREDSSYHAGLDINPRLHTWKWAGEVLGSNESTYEDRCRARKVRTLLRFPGLNWDDDQLWYDADFSPGLTDSGPLAAGASLWAESFHYSALWAEDTKEAESILTQRLKAAHLLPKSGARATLAAIFRPLVEKLLEAGEVTPGGATEAQIKAKALSMAGDIRRFWRLSITADQSDTAIANKIARKFGLTLTRSVKVGDNRLWAYTIEASEAWLSLVAARKWALENSGTNSLEIALSRFVPGLPGDPNYCTADPPDPTNCTPDQGGGLGNLPLTA